MSGLKMSELSKTDCSRDLLTLKHHREMVTDVLRANELKLSGQIDCLTKEINGYRQQVGSIAETLVPRNVFADGSSEQIQWSTPPAVVCCLINVDKLIADDWNPRDVVSLINSFVEKLDRIVAKNQQFCTLSATPTSDSYTMLVGPPEQEHLPAHCAVFIANEIATEMTDCTANFESRSSSAIDETMDALSMSLSLSELLQMNSIKSTTNEEQIKKKSKNQKKVSIDCRIGVALDKNQLKCHIFRGVFFPPRLTLVGPTVVRSIKAAEEADVNFFYSFFFFQSLNFQHLEIVAEKEIVQALDETPYKDFYISEPFTVDTLDDSRDHYELYRVSSLNRDYLLDIVKPSLSKSRASSSVSALSRSSKASSGGVVYHESKLRELKVKIEEKMTEQQQKQAETPVSFLKPGTPFYLQDSLTRTGSSMSTVSARTSKDAIEKTNVEVISEDISLYSSQSYLSTTSRNCSCFGKRS